MKNIFRNTLLLTALVLTFAACEKNDINNGTHQGDSTTTEREIIYSVGDNEIRQTIETEEDWDALLDQLCDQAQNGNEVAFFNISHKTSTGGLTKSAPKENRTINTTNRNEIKAWMKEMEKKGLTVHVTYDDNSGTWHGTAYATAPTDNTSGTIIGSWHFICMVVSQSDWDGTLIGSDLYEPMPDGGTMQYLFSADGTVTLTMVGEDGTTANETGTWSLSEDGILSSELLPNGLNWNVNWISANTMILSRDIIGTEEGNYHYQLQFESVVAEK